MKYHTEHKPAINPGFSISKLNDDSSLVSINGLLKKLECNAEILADVLKMANGDNTFANIEEKYIPQFGEDEVKDFLTTLLNEEVIIASSTKPDVALPDVCVIGSGRLFEVVCSVFNENLNIVRTISIADFFQSPTFEYKSAIIVPEKTKLMDMFQLNRLFVANNMPYFLMYFNGKGITIGPFVFPWKTPCYECHATHRIRLLSKNSGVPHTIKQMEGLALSHDLPESYPLERIEFLASIVLQDVGSIERENKEFKFVRTEKTMTADGYEFTDTRKYQPITDCVCCQGMSKNFVHFSSTPIDEIGDRVESPAPTTSDTIKYKLGGYRSKDISETSAFINAALERVGLDIEIKQNENSPFISALPVYKSILRATHRNKTPYFLNEQISHGKGLTETQAYFSAAFEILERLSSRHYGEISIIRGSANEVRPYGIDIETFANQIHNPNTLYDKYTPDFPIDWVWGESLISGERKLVPASMVFLTTVTFRGKFFNDTSSGLSSGATLNDAILQGLLEVIEHDAWNIAQANPIQVPELDFTGLSNHKLTETIGKIESLGYSVIARDYTNLKVG